MAVSPKKWLPIAILVVGITVVVLSSIILVAVYWRTHTPAKEPASLQQTADAQKVDPEPEFRSLRVSWAVMPEPPEPHLRRQPRGARRRTVLEQSTLVDEQVACEAAVEFGANPHIQPGHPLSTRVAARMSAQVDSMDEPSYALPASLLVAPVVSSNTFPKEHEPTELGDEETAPLLDYLNLSDRQQVSDFVTGRRDSLDSSVIDEFHTSYPDLCSFVKKFYQHLSRMTRHLTASQLASIKAKYLPSVQWDELANSPISAEDPQSPCNARFSPQQLAVIPLDAFRAACNHDPTSI